MEHNVPLHHDNQAGQKPEQQLKQSSSRPPTKPHSSSIPTTSKTTFSSAPQASSSTAHHPKHLNPSGITSTTTTTSSSSSSSAIASATTVGSSSTQAQGQARNKHQKPKQQQHQGRTKRTREASQGDTMANKGSGNSRKKQKGKNRKRSITPTSASSILQAVDTNQNAAPSVENTSPKEDPKALIGNSTDSGSSPLAFLSSTPPRGKRVSAVVWRRDETEPPIAAASAVVVSDDKKVDTPSKEPSKKAEVVASSPLTPVQAKTNKGDVCTSPSQPEPKTLNAPQKQHIQTDSGMPSQVPATMSSPSVETSPTLAAAENTSDTSSPATTAADAPPAHQKQLSINGTATDSSDEKKDGDVPTPQPHRAVEKTFAPVPAPAAAPAVNGGGNSVAAAPAKTTPEMEPVGIKWAPLNVPFKRRLQTLVVLFHCLSIAITVSLFFFTCANPLMWFLLMIYMIKILSSTAHSDGKLSRRNNFIRRLPIWRLFADYFPARLHKTAELPPTRKYIFGYHPHGIISHGAWVAFASEALGFGELFPGITNTLLTLDSNFRIPFYRDYILSMGLGSVSKEGIMNILSKGGRNNEGMGRAVTIVIGGARESLEAHPGRMSLVLKGRKGFIRMAMRAGADLVPVLNFGENELYDQLDPGKHPTMRQFQMWALSAWKFTLPFLHGRGIFNYDVGLMPYRHPMHIVVGRPIKVDILAPDAVPDDDEIDRLHTEYLAELNRLWNEYKGRFAQDKNIEMKILA